MRRRAAYDLPLIGGSQLPGLDLNRLRERLDHDDVALAPGDDRLALAA